MARQRVAEGHRAGANARIPPKTSAPDEDAGDEAGDDRQAGRHVRGGYQYDGPGRLRRAALAFRSHVRPRRAPPHRASCRRSSPRSASTFLAAGLLTYTNPVDAGPSAGGSASPDASLEPSPSTLISLPPLGSAPSRRVSPSAPADRVATRVRIAALGIDLPVIAPANGALPLCNVAM